MTGQAGHELNHQLNHEGVLMGPVLFTDEEFTELLLLIDDEPVDEDLLQGIRQKLSAKRRRLRRRLREDAT